MNRSERRNQMKRLIAICGVIALLSATSSAIASMYVETVDVYQYAIGPAKIGYTHTYDHSADPILTATLSIVADDVDLGELDMVSVQDFGGTWHDLGYLSDMGSYTNWNYYPGAGNPNQPLTTTVFNLDPSWINGLPVNVKVDADWGVEIETSTLTVEQVPVPGAILLGILGLGAAGLKLRKFA